MPKPNPQTTPEEPTLQENMMEYLDASVAERTRTLAETLHPAVREAVDYDLEMLTAIRNIIKEWREPTLTHFSGDQDE